MKKTGVLIFCVFISVFFGDCNNDPKEDYISLAYDNNYNAPKGFYIDKDIKESGFDVFYIHYLGTRDLITTWDKPLSSIQLHAKDTEELKSVAYTFHFESIKIIETEKYFQFGSYESKRVYRIHRSGYFTPQFDTADITYFFEEFKGEKNIGVYGGGLTVKKVKEFFDYLWVLPLNNRGGPKVVEAKVSDKTGVFEYNIKSVIRTISIEDRICLYNEKFTLDKKTGAVVFTEKKLLEEVYLPGGGLKILLKN